MRKRLNSTVRRLHLWVTAFAATVWFGFASVAVPLFVVQNLDSYTGSGLSSAWAFFGVGVAAWMSWLYLEYPKLLKALRKARYGP